MLSRGFEYYKASSIEKAIALLRNGEAVVLAGGTDLLVRAKLGLVKAKSLIDIKHLNELRYIKLLNREGLIIGSATTIREIQESMQVRELFPVLAMAATKIGSVQIRNMGSVGGNICQENMCKYFNQPSFWREVRKGCYKAGGDLCYALNQKKGVCFSVYRGDLAPVLIALGAKVRICKQDAQEEILLEDFFTGKGDKPNVLTADGILKEIYIPIPRGESRAIYLKNSYRSAVDYPNVGVAIHATIAHDGICERVSILVGGMQPRPVRLSELEISLVNKTLNLDKNEDRLEKINKIVANACKPILNNIPNTSPYFKRRIATSLLSDGLSKIGII